MIARTSKRRGSGRKPSVLYTSHVKDGKDTGSQFTPLAFDAPPTTGRILVLPGKLPRRLFFVSFDACEIALTPNELELLVNVAYWRVTTTLGLTPFCNSDSKDSLHQTIKRLRASIDAHMGSGHGKLIIEHSNDSLYFLAVDVIIVHPLFPEIAAGSVGDCFRLSNSKVDIVDDLIRHCPFPSPDNPICQRFAKALSVVAL